MSLVFQILLIPSVGEQIIVIVFADNEELVVDRVGLVGRGGPGGR